MFSTSRSFTRPAHTIVTASQAACSAGSLSQISACKLKSRSGFQFVQSHVTVTANIYFVVEEHLILLVEVVRPEEEPTQQQA